MTGGTEATRAAGAPGPLGRPGPLAGKVALITGSARGQGEVTARRFVAAGAQVMITDILAAEGAKVAASLGDAAVFQELDVSDETAWAAAVAALRASFGRLDVLVNNAAIHWIRPLLEDNAADLDRLLAVNLRGPFLGIQACVPLMLEGDGGSIINIASIAGVKAFRGHGVYGAAKWGLRGMSKVAALELAPRIRVNCILPGAIDSPMLPPGAAERVSAGTPMGRLGRSDEIAEGALYLASAASSYTTGTDLVIDGGSTT
ncbi:glucose 1-dehydrogenase [Frankia sp. CcI49]|uniref:SDR family NAD(P)-dependent oxidoreductase n=1 Tax=Frankia sp. CcI49 TaxID=1745382 RepID=UPI000976F9A1|nr:glucose 1-dehydrogenase [Frankia sp. CcI49]